MDSDTGNQEAMLVYILDLILIAALLVFMLLRINAYEDSTYHEKTYLSKDLALLVDTISASPYEISYLYDPSKVDLSKFSFSFKDRVTVEDDSKIYYPFAKNDLIPFRAEDMENPSRIYLENKNRVYIAEDTGASTCSKSLDTKDPDWKKNLIVLDPHKAEKGVDEDIMWVLADNVKGYLNANVKLTSEDPTQDKQDFQNYDLLIEMKAGMGQKTVTPIIISYDQTDSRARKLSCILKERFEQANLKLGANQVRVERKPGASFVSLEIGNVLNDDSILKENKKIKDIWQTIADGITEFYKG
ncbi:MAG: hypothetical protein ACLFP2_00475 [Candidatus Woesearchaeota archaeon]